MGKFKIKYNEGDHINKESIVEAESLYDAMVKFTMNNINADITKILDVTDVRR